VVYLALIDIVGYLISIVIMLVIVQFVLSLLFSFNVVDRHSQWAGGLWHAVNALLAPVLRPIQRIMPDTGMIDFSPMVLIVLLTVLQKILGALAIASMQ
jgi:YggT family protein